MFKTTDNHIIQTVAQSKWDKAKVLIKELFDLYLDHDNPTMSYKRLEIIRGFLCHLSMTYFTITPYLKGFHLTLAAHHPKRDSQGWKLSPKEWEAYVWGAETDGKVTFEEATSLSSEGQEKLPPGVKYKKPEGSSTFDDLPKPPEKAKPIQSALWRMKPRKETWTMLLCSCVRIIRR